MEIYFLVFWFIFPPDYYFEKGSLRGASTGRLCLHKERLGLPGLHEEQDHSNTGLDPFKWFDIVY